VRGSTDDRQAVWFPWGMLDEDDERLEGMPGYGSTEPATPLEIAGGLHRVALEYWAEGRIDDARRVALEASRLVKDVESGSRLRSDIAATIDALARQ